MAHSENDSKPKNNNELKIVIKKDTLTTWVCITILVVSLMFIGYSFIQGYSQEDAEEFISESGKQSIELAGLNAYVLAGSAWSYGSTDEVLEESKTVATDSAGDDKVFDLKTDALKREIVPVLLYSGASAADADGNSGYDSFLTLSFKKAPTTFDESLIENMKKEIETTLSSQEGFLGVDITNAEILEDGGIYIEGVYRVDLTTAGDDEETGETAATKETDKKATATAAPTATPKPSTETTDKNTNNVLEVYYAQYTKPYGVNMATAIMGTKNANADFEDVVVDLVNGVVIP